MNEGKTYNEEEPWSVDVKVNKKKKKKASVKSKNNGMESMTNDEENFFPHFD